MKPIAYIYTCRNPGKAALLWAHQPPPFGHGWIDVKRVGLVREDEVSEVIRNGEKCVESFNIISTDYARTKAEVQEARILLTKCMQRFQKEMYGDPIADRIGRFIDTTA
jgi:hypothetical protein